MQYLRSPASHGIARDYRTIRRTIRRGQDFTPPYHRPSITLFAEHLDRHREATLTGVPRVQAWAREIRPAPTGAGYTITVSGDCGDSTISCEVAILAVGQPSPRMPQVLQSLPSTAAVYHVHRDTTALDHLPRGSEVALVGGGIAAAHLAVALSGAGHHVTIWNRDRFTSHQFDSDPCFVGPRCGGIIGSIGDYRHRRSLIQRSRRPGSVPPDLFRELRRLEHSRRIRIIRGEVTHAAATGSVGGIGDRVLLRSETWRREQSGEFDAVVACTGFGGGPPAPDLIQHTADALRAPRAEDGYPIPSGDLQWAPGLFVTGALAELEIGPPARNLVGAHLAGRRIIPALRTLVSS
ncbi:MAG: SidA/IucD/PvdA family monooxygenase [Alkalispirochaeta sp.]